MPPKKKQPVTADDVLAKYFKIKNQYEKNLQHGRDNINKDKKLSVKVLLIFGYILVLAALIYILDTIALITALCVIPMYPNGSPNRIMLVVFLVIGGFIFFGVLSKLGEKYSNYMLSNYKDANSTAGTTMLNDEKDEEIDKSSADDDNLRKMSLGARAARKV